MKKIIVAIFLLVFNISFAQMKPADDQSQVSFRIKNFGFGVTGSFRGLDGTVIFDPAQPYNGSFNISIDAASVNTDNSLRDEHLRGETYFDVKKYPRIRIQSTSVTGSKNALVLAAKLYIKDKVKDISIPFTVTPAGSGYVFAGAFSINRKDFNVGGNSTISDKLDVILKVTVR